MAWTRTWHLRSSPRVVPPLRSLAFMQRRGCARPALALAGLDADGRIGIKGNLLVVDRKTYFHSCGDERECNAMEGKAREERKRGREEARQRVRGAERERQTGKDRFHMLARLIRLIIARMVFVTAPCVDSRCVDGPPHFQRAERVLLGRVCLCAGSFLFAWKMFQERLGILLEVFCLGCALHSVCAVFCIGPHTSRITHSKTSTHQRDKLSPNLHEVSRPGTSFAANLLQCSVF